MTHCAADAQLNLRSGSPADAQDLEACDRVCRFVHGHDRHGEVLDAITQGTARV